MLQNILVGAKNTFVSDATLVSSVQVNAIVQGRIDDSVLGRCSGGNDDASEFEPLKR